MNIFLSLRTNCDDFYSNIEPLVSIGLNAWVNLDLISDRDLAAEHSTIKANLMERLQASNDKLSSVSEERDLLNANLTSVSKELDTLQSLSKQSECSPACVCSAQLSLNMKDRSCHSLIIEHQYTENVLMRYLYPTLSSVNYIYGQFTLYQ